MTKRPQATTRNDSSRDDGERELVEKETMSDHAEAQTSSEQERGKTPDANPEKEAPAKSANTSSGKQSQTTTELDKLQAVGFSGVSLTVGVLISIAAFLLSSAYLLMDKFLVQPEVEKRKTMENVLTARTAEISDLKRTYQVTEDNMRKVVENLQFPVLLHPAGDESVVSETVEFRWKYPKVLDKESYIEIRGAAKSYRFQILPPQQQVTHVPTHYLGQGQFYWRVMSGLIGEEPPSDGVQGFGSGFGRFNLYESILQRIAATQELRIGLTPIFEGPFSYPSSSGQLTGIDIDLVNWLADKLPGQLNLAVPLRPRLVSMGWDDLLPALSRGNIDVIVSHMTASKSREAAHPNVLFSKAYLRVDPALLSRSKVEGDIWSAVQGRTIGAVKNSTNEACARYLADKKGFAVNSNFESITEAILALDRGDVQFVWTDDVLTSDDFSKNGDYFIYNESLVELLKPFYKKEYGEDRNGDELSVAVNVLGPGGKVLEAINSIIDSTSGKEFLQQEADCWMRRGKYACENAKRLEYLQKRR